MTPKLHPWILAVGHGAVWVCDERLPVVVRADRRSGEITGVVSWPVKDDLRDLPSIGDIAIGSDAVWLAAPNAAGLVRLAPNLDSDVQVVPMTAPIGMITAHGATCWAREHSHGGEPDGPLGPAVWRVTSDGAAKVELGGYVWRIEATEEGLLALMQRPARAHDEQPHAGAGTAWLYPGVLVRIRDGDVEEILPLEDLGGASLHVARDRAWVQGGGHRDPAWLAEVDLERSALGPPAPLPSPLGLAIDGRFAWAHTNDRRHLASWDRQEVFVRVPLESNVGLESYRVVVRGDVAAFVADGEVVWASREADAHGERPPVRIDAETLEVVEWPVDVDVTALLPEPRPPDGLDPAAHAEEQREQLARSRIEDLTFDDVLLRGEFPHTELVVLFRSRRHRGVLFGRRWAVFDDFGLPQCLSYVSLELEEDVVAAGHGLPPVERCVPDDQGIVWF